MDNLPLPQFAELTLCAWDAIDKQIVAVAGRNLMGGSDPMLFSYEDLRKLYVEHYTVLRVEDDVQEAARALSTRFRQEARAQQAAQEARAQQVAQEARVADQVNYLWSLFLRLYGDTAQRMNKDTWVPLVSKKLPMPEKELHQCKSMSLEQWGDHFLLPLPSALNDSKKPQESTPSKPGPQARIRQAINQFLDMGALPTRPFTFAWRNESIPKGDRNQLKSILKATSQEPLTEDEIEKIICLLDLRRFPLCADKVRQALRDTAARVFTLESQSSRNEKATSQSEATKATTHLPTSSNATTNHTPMSFAPSDEQQKHMFNAKVDLVDLSFPCAMEVKSPASAAARHGEVFEQVLKRLDAFAQTHGHVKRVVFFGVAPPVCTVFFATSEYKGLQMKWDVQMYPIHPDQSIPLWTALNDIAKQDASWYLHPEAYSLRLLTQKLWQPIIKEEGPPIIKESLPLAYFSVQFQAISSSGTVFLLNAPALVNSSRTKTAIYRHNSHTIAVKVFHDPKDYDNEITSLQCLSQSLSDADGTSAYPLLRNHGWKSSQFYALAHADFIDPKSELTWFPTASNSASVRALPSTPAMQKIMNENRRAVAKGFKELWWSRQDDEEKWGCTRRQILVMRPGVPADHNLAEWDKITDIVFSFLGILHSHQRVHRDVRLSNIMIFQFEEGTNHPKTTYMPQLIDYGFSCPTDTDTDDHPDTPHDMLDLGFRRYKWDTCLDYRLFLNTRRKYDL